MTKLDFDAYEGVDQPAQPCSLISVFVTRSLESCNMANFILLLVSVAEQAGLSPTWSETPKTGFLAVLPISTQRDIFRQYREIQM